MRVLLIAFSYVNLLLYLAIYGLYEMISPLIGFSSLGQGAQTFIRVALLVIAGFFIGLVASVYKKGISGPNSFDYDLFLLLGLLPFILLVLSEGSMVDLFTRVFFPSGQAVTRFFAHLFSSWPVFALWYGLSIGVSVKVGSVGPARPSGANNA
jgi:hypothetical protein